MKKSIILLLFILTTCSSIRNAGKLYDAGDYDATIAECERILSADSTNADAHFLLGRSYQKKGNQIETIQHLTKAHQFNAKNNRYKTTLIEAKLEYSDSLITRGENYRALQQLKSVMQLDSTSLKSRLKLASYYYNNAMLSSALFHYSKIDSEEEIGKIETRIAQAKVHYEKGLADYNKYAYGAANKNFAKTVNINAEHKDAKYYLALSQGILLYKAGDKSSLWDAIEALGKAMSLKLDSGEPHFYMALAYEKKNRKEFDNAIDEYKLAIEKEPDGYFASQCKSRIKELTELKKRLKDFWGK